MKYQTFGRADTDSLRGILSREVINLEPLSIAALPGILVGRRS